MSLFLISLFFPLFNTILLYLNLQCEDEEIPEIDLPSAKINTTAAAATTQKENDKNEVEKDDNDDDEDIPDMEEFDEENNLVTADVVCT